MRLANPSAPVRPWLDYKSYGDRDWYDTANPFAASCSAALLTPTALRCRDALPAGPTDHYQERQLHLFLSGVDTFYYFVRAWLPRAIVVCSDRGRE